MCSKKNNQMPDISGQKKTVNLPPKETKRWVKSRKLAVLKAIKNGHFKEEEACAYYDLSPEELASWKRLLSRHGPDALKATHLKHYRKKDLLSDPHPAGQH